MKMLIMKYKLIYLYYFKIDFEFELFSRSMKLEVRNRIDAIEYRYGIRSEPYSTVYSRLIQLFSLEGKSAYFLWRWI